MFDKEFLGYLSITLTLIGYAPYFRSILKRQTKPHMFSWIVWALVNGIAFIGPYTRGAGAGAWVAGVTALLCLAIAALCVPYGDKRITKSDWIAFTAALAAIPLWILTEDPLSALILAIFIDVAGCYPTVRKSYINPYEENLFTWSMSAVRSLVSLFAIEQYSLVTTIFPLVMVFTNGGIALLLIGRRFVCKQVVPSGDAEPPS